MPQDSVVDQRTSGIRAGLCVLLGWLDAHSHIPFLHVDYVDGHHAELVARSGRFDALRAAAAAAETLTDPTMVVSDRPPDSRSACQITVTGRTGPLSITVAGLCFDETADALINSLGPPDVPGERSWTTTGEHLRSLLPAGA